MSDGAQETDEETTTIERQWPVVITLAHPVDFGSERITSLSMRRGKLGDLKGIKLGGEIAVDNLIKVAARMSGRQVEVIEDLAPIDAQEVMSVVLDFFAKCLGGGKTR